jgi:hypothetical protein
MEHYEVLDVMNRQQGPDLMLRLDTDIFEAGREKETIVASRFLVKNISLKPAEFFQLSIWLDKGIKAERTFSFFPASLDTDANILLPETMHQIAANKYVFTVKPDIPLFGDFEISFPVCSNRVEKWRLEIDRVIPQFGGNYIQWMLEAPKRLRNKVVLNSRRFERDVSV